VSFQVSCKDQEEVDKFWYGLSAGGEEGPCGWLKDRYGVSWQVVPTVLPELLSNPDPEKAQKVMAAMMQMGKLDIAALQNAAEAA
jgi:predicted 3-demethylubiquinone-9 3-methyltransferase (glyoxalase superfamily)